MTVVILLGGVLLIVSILVWFGASGRYRMLADDLGPAEREWVAREAVDLLAELASRALVLVRMERIVEAVLRDREAGMRVAVRRCLMRAGLPEFWGEFVRTSALVEEDPARAVREMPALRSALEESLQAYDEVLGMLGVADESVLVVERGEDHGGARE